jgi:hypothetical protein
MDEIPVMSAGRDRPGRDGDHGGEEGQGKGSSERCRASDREEGSEIRLSQ